MGAYFDTGSLIIIVITFLLFAAALFTKGFTHDLLLEAGVLLVSIKLIKMGYDNSLHIRSLENELRAIKRLLEQK